ncbi:MAG TPA: GGDEF domain-containing phosphodiesterase, partial [Novosphingobium sp.]
DEFAVVCQAKTHEKIDLIARSIITVMAEPFTVAGTTLHIGATIGIAMAPQDGVDANNLLRYADLALYCAKSDQRGTVRRFDPEMDAAAQEKARTENDLRRAVRHGELVIHYQPLIDLATNQIIGYEALLRWNHPERGMLYPDSFIGLAEEIGMIDVIGQYVLQAACREAATWPDGIKLAVNASPLQFRGGNLLNIILQALAMSGLEPSRLEIEITEAVLMDRSPAIASLLESIRNLGVGISMDDFGTGYSSLSYLLSYPFTKIKIDKSFIMGLREANSKAVVSAIIGLGQSLGMMVTAEGIEEPEHMEYLRGIGCGQGQGYLIGRATPGDQLPHEGDQRRDVA